MARRNKKDLIGERYGFLSASFVRTICKQKWKTVEVHIWYKHFKWTAHTHCPWNLAFLTALFEWTQHIVHRNQCVARLPNRIRVVSDKVYETTHELNMTRSMYEYTLHLRKATNTCYQLLFQSDDIKNQYKNLWGLLQRNRMHTIGWFGWCGKYQRSLFHPSRFSQVARYCK